MRRTSLLSKRAKQANPSTPHVLIGTARAPTTFTGARETFEVYESTITFKGELAPGPDYRLYLAPSYVENEAEFLAIKAQSLEVGPVKTFNGFAFNNVSALRDPALNTLVIWCEAFGEFITSARFRSEP